MLVLDIGSLVICPKTRKVVGFVQLFYCFLIVQIFDVFGPVSAPYYTVLVRLEFFESFAEGSTISFSEKHISLVSKESLSAEKGNDGDPDDPGDFSDDESEFYGLKGQESGQI